METMRCIMQMEHFATSSSSPLRSRHESRFGKVDHRPMMTSASTAHELGPFCLAARHVCAVISTPASHFMELLQSLLAGLSIIHPLRASVSEPNGAGCPRHSFQLAVVLKFRDPRMGRVIVLAFQVEDGDGRRGEVRSLSTWHGGPRTRTHEPADPCPCSTLSRHQCLVHRYSRSRAYDRPRWAVQMSSKCSNIDCLEDG